MAEQTVSRGWTFLVARGRRKGYRSVLVPDFLTESNEYGILGETVGGDFPPSGSPRIESVSAPVAGVITLVYQTCRLTYADLDEERSPENSTASNHATDDLITDEHGRPLDLLYGFVCRAPRIRETNEADLIAARTEALHVYRRFLADETGFTLELSKPFVLRSVTSGPEKPSREIPTPRTTTQPSRPPNESPPGAAAAHPLPSRRRSRLNPIIVAVMVVIASAIFWIVILLPERGPATEIGTVTEVNVAEPEPSTVDCTAPVTFVFRAIVTTNGPAKVEYHWEGSADDVGTGRHQLIFDQAASKPVETTLLVPGSPGRKISGNQKLVVDAPNSKMDSVEYSRTCETPKDPKEKPPKGPEEFGA